MHQEPAKREYFTIKAIKTFGIINYKLVTNATL